MGWALHTKHMRRIFDGAVVREKEMKARLRRKYAACCDWQWCCFAKTRQDEIR